MSDLRTRAGIEKQILDQVESKHGFSIFWITENQKRAHAAVRLESAGKIIRVRDKYDAYPWCHYKLSDSNNT